MIMYNEISKNPSPAFYDKMKRGIFRSDEMQKMIDYVGIENPCEIFFAPEVEQQDTSQNCNRC